MHFAEQKECTLASASRLLNSLDDAQFNNLTETVFNVLLDPAQSDTLSSSLNGLCSASGISLSEGKQATNNYLSFIMECVKKNMGVPHIEKEATSADLSDQKTRVLTDLYTAHHTKLSARHISRSTANSLRDMEWKFGVTAASSELNTVGQTFLQLKLDIGDSVNSETVHMELSLPEFYDFLHKMEQAKASMELTM